MYFKVLFHETDSSKNTNFSVSFCSLYSQDSKMKHKNKFFNNDIIWISIVKICSTWYLDIHYKFPLYCWKTESQYRIRKYIWYIFFVVIFSKRQAICFKISLFNEVHKRHGINRNITLCTLFKKKGETRVL